MENESNLIKSRNWRVLELFIADTKVLLKAYTAPVLSISGETAHILRVGQHPNAIRIDTVKNIRICFIDRFVEYPNASFIYQASSYADIDWFFQQFYDLFDSQGKPHLVSEFQDFKAIFSDYVLDNIQDVSIKSRFVREPRPVETKRRPDIFVATREPEERR